MDVLGPRQPHPSKDELVKPWLTEAPIRYSRLDFFLVTGLSSMRTAREKCRGQDDSCRYRFLFRWLVYEQPGVVGGPSFRWLAPVKR